MLRSGWLTTGKRRRFLSKRNSHRSSIRATAPRACGRFRGQFSYERTPFGDGGLRRRAPGTSCSRARTHSRRRPKSCGYLGADVAFVDVGPRIRSISIRKNWKRRYSGASGSGTPRLPAPLAESSADSGCGPIRQSRGSVAPCALRRAALRHGCAYSLIARALRSLRVVEDAAHAFPSAYRRKLGYAGTIGDVGVFSFYATKTITTGEGGMIVTADG